MTRILITGSRSWDDIDIIKAALSVEFLRDPDGVLVSGGQRSRRPGPNKTTVYFGADYQCEKVWGAFGGRIERHTANWVRYGKSAGFRRNEWMVRQGADICIAFIRNGSPGATMTANLAEKHGIPVFRIAIDDKTKTRKKKSLPKGRLTH